MITTTKKINTFKQILSLFCLVIFLVLIPLISLAQEATSYCEPQALNECQRLCTAEGHTVIRTSPVFSRTDRLIGYDITCSGPFSGPTPGPGYTPPPIPRPTPTPVNNEFIPLVGIPGIDPGDDFGSYINALYVLSISLAALLAVIKIIIAGVKWMLTDVVTSKADAKKDIQGALLGLLIIISAVVILTVINPNLVEFKMLPEAAVTTP